MIMGNIPPSLRRGLAPVALGAALLFAGGARADDRPFAFAYSTDIGTQGEREIEQEITWTSGHGGEAFQGIESRSEFEYGITDDFQGSFYLNYDWSRARPHAPPGPAETSSLAGVSGEFIYRLMNVYFDPIGLALYAEPSVGNGTRAFELKALFQKNFFNDDLRLVLNVNAENRWEKNVLGQYDRSSALEFYSGLAYNITPEWSLGAELDHERGYDGLILGGSPRYADNATFAGPAIQYVGHPVRATFGVEAQLPWAGGASGYLPGAERVRLRLRLATDF